MNAEVLRTVSIGCALAAGLSGGATWAFSSFVMRGLGRLGDAGAVRAMQAINEAALRPAFLVIFIGTGLALLGLTIAAHVGGVLQPTLGLGTALYLVGVIGVTVVGNVPLNEALATRDPATASWAAYATPWLRWNHLRTVVAAAASACVFAAAFNG